MRERKACDLYEFSINSTDFRLFLSFRLRHLPHQRKALIWKPLLFIIQLHFTDDANAGGQGRRSLKKELPQKINPQTRVIPNFNMCISRFLFVFSESKFENRTFSVASDPVRPLLALQ